MLVTAVLLLVVTQAAPAAASVYTGEVIAGTMTIDFPSPYSSMTRDLDDPERPCIASPVRGNPPTVSLDFASVPNSGNSSTTATGMDLATQYIDFGFFGSHHWYELELSLVTPAPSGMSNAGVVWGPIMVQDLVLQVIWYSYGSGVDLDPAEPCPPKTPRCAGISELGLSGTWTSASQLADLDDVAELLIIPQFCVDTAVVEVFDESTITISGMVIDF